MNRPEKNLPGTSTFSWDSKQQKQINCIVVSGTVGLPLMTGPKVI